ncbi:hypothetical protein G3576_07415 [Roseomonas stagni]|uniref:Uncharacterized protein n=1 Tax=Falsiroseomonas algicola TaxID=2716930 RepID=A0A6M1LIK4_9PROT|nr:hypothetical protein [Falsiroseomonas algicola]NGM19839.1 hypothetical protein [Falsiroseomonas algicola]
MSGEDDTIRVTPARPAPAAEPLSWGSPAPPPPPPPRRPGPAPALLAVMGVVAAGGAAGLLWWTLLAPGAEAPAPAPVPPSAPPIASAPAPPVATTPAPPAPVPEPPSRLARMPVLMDLPSILGHRATVPTMLRLADETSIFIIDFPSLEQQGAALNRVAALVEKAGLPRDRVLTPEELAAAIVRAGDTPATYYYGHNYRGAELERFFALAARDGLALSPDEAWVEAQFRLARGLVPRDREIAVISMAAPGPLMDASARASVLRHELSHGYFATRPAYAEHIRRVWRAGFTEAEREAFRQFLAREQYDRSNEEVMLDEAQAYLLHTPDPRFFSPAHLGLPAEQVARMRALMRRGAPGLE